MIAGKNNTRNSRIALSQSKSHCREAGAHAQATGPRGVVGKDRTLGWCEQKTKAVDGVGRRLEAPSQRKPPIKRVIEAEFENIEPEDRQ